MRLTLHAGRPEPGTRRHTGTRAVQRDHRLPVPPWLCFTPRGPGPRSAHLAWCSRLSAPAENMPPLLQAHQHPERCRGLPGSCHMTCHVTGLRPGLLPRPPSSHVPAGSRGRNWRASCRLPVPHHVGGPPPPSSARDRLPVLRQVGGAGRRPWPKYCSTEPVPGQLPSISPRQPAAREPWNRGPWNSFL